jgi:hypothetical protein
MEVFEVLLEAWTHKPSKQGTLMVCEVYHLSVFSQAQCPEVQGAQWEGRFEASTNETYCSLYDPLTRHYV